MAIGRGAFRSPKRSSPEVAVEIIEQAIHLMTQRRDGCEAARDTPCLSLFPSVSTSTLWFSPMSSSLSDDSAHHTET
jgi:hypothetical protein